MSTPTNAPKPDATLLIVLGAKKFPQMGGLRSEPKLAEFAALTEEFLTSPIWFGIPGDTNVLNLFNKDILPAEIHRTIHDFVDAQGRRLKNQGNDIIDVIVYYVGHGGSDVGGEFRLAIRGTVETDLEFTALTLSSIQNALRRFDFDSSLRRLFILDCCFAGKALSSWTADSKDVDTVLLCASGSRTAARIDRYPFTPTLIEVLKLGEEKETESFSLLDVQRLLLQHLPEQSGTNVAIPQVQCPGGVGAASVLRPFFPNVGRIKPTGGGVYQAYLEMHDKLKRAKFCTEVDRRRAAAIADRVKFAVAGAKQQRLSLRRISQILAKAEFSHILDFGSGYPTKDHLHSMAPDATVIYSDNDPRTCRIGADMTRRLRETGLKCNFFEADVSNPEPLLSRLQNQGLLVPEVRTAYVFWGLGCFVQDADLRHALEALYNWASPGSVLVFQAQAHSTNPEGEKLREIVRQYAEFGVRLRFRRPQEYCDLLGPWCANIADFVPVAQLIKQDVSAMSIPMQDFVQTGGVGSGLFLEKVEGGARVSRQLMELL